MPPTECARSAQCAPYKHHYEECVERVTSMNEDPEYKGPKEDCVEECTLAINFSVFPKIITDLYSSQSSICSTVQQLALRPNCSKPSDKTFDVRSFHVYYHTLGSA
jgi:hypothetical protein